MIEREIDKERCGEESKKTVYETERDAHRACMLYVEKISRLQKLTSVGHCPESHCWKCGIVTFHYAPPKKVVAAGNIVIDKDGHLFRSCGELSQNRELLRVCGVNGHPTKFYISDWKEVYISKKVHTYGLQCLDCANRDDHSICRVCSGTKPARYVRESEKEKGNT